MIHDRLPPEYKAASQMQRAWDYPKIATRPDSGCACYSPKSQFPHPRAALFLRRDLWYTVGKSPKGGLRMAERRVFAGYYKRYDGKPIFVIRVLKDIDTGEAILVLQGCQLFPRGQRTLLPHPLRLLLRTGRSRWCAAG